MRKLFYGHARIKEAIAESAVRRRFPCKHVLDANGIICIRNSKK